MKQKSLKITLSFVLFLSFILIDSANAATTISLIEASPKNGDKHVPLDKNFTFTFNEKIVDIHKDKIKLYKKDIYSRYVLEPIEEISFSGKTARIVPKNKLVFNKDYKLEIESYTFQFTDGYYYTRPINNYFKTDFMSFYDLLVIDHGRLASLLETYSNRQLIISTPERYINEVTINHKKQGKVEDDPSQTVTDSLTNIDISLKDYNVSRINVQILSNNKVLKTDTAKKFQTAKGPIYTLSYGGLPTNFDVKISVVDSHYSTMDELILKVAAGDKIFTEVKEKYVYKTTGKSFSLYELISDEDLFNTLLMENNIHKIMVQVDK